MTQINMPAPQRSSVDGKVWMQNNGTAVIHRLDLATGNVETFDPFKDATDGKSHNIYDVIPDSHNNVYFTDFEHEQIGRVDAEDGARSRCITCRPSAPRRAVRRWIPRTGFGSVNTGAIASPCSTRRPKNSRSGSRQVLERALRCDAG